MNIAVIRRFLERNPNASIEIEGEHLRWLMPPIPRGWCGQHDPLDGPCPRCRRSRWYWRALYALLEAGW